MGAIVDRTSGKVSVDDYKAGEDVFNIPFGEDILSTSGDFSLVLLLKILGDRLVSRSVISDVTYVFTMRGGVFKKECGAESVKEKLVGLGASSVVPS